MAWPKPKRHTRAGQGRAGQGRAGQGCAGQGRAGQGRRGAGAEQGQGRAVNLLGSKGVRQDDSPVGVEGEHIEDDLDDGHRKPDWHEQSHHLVAPGMCTVQQPHD